MTTTDNTPIRFRPDGSIDTTPVPGSAHFVTAVGIETARFAALAPSGYLRDNAAEAFTEELLKLPSIQAVRRCVDDLLLEEQMPKPRDIARWRANYLDEARAGAAECRQCNGTGFIQRIIRRILADGSEIKAEAYDRCTNPHCRGGKLL